MMKRFFFLFHSVVLVAMELQVRNSDLWLENIVYNAHIDDFAWLG